MITRLLAVPFGVLLFVVPPGALHAETIAITGAEVHTVADAGTLENATILVEDGRIAAVGRDVDVPADARRVDAGGKVVTPGLFSPLGQLGLTEVNAVEGTVDYVQRGDDYSAGFDVAAAYNPDSTLIAVNRIEGITRAAILPGAAAPEPELGRTSHVLSGLGAIVQLGDSRPAVAKRAAVLVVNFGEGGAAVAGGSRAAAWLELRSALDDALDYAGHREEFERGERREYSVSRADLEALQSVIEGTTPVLAYADRQSDIRQLLELENEYGLQLIIAGGAEAWMLADEIAAADASVILNAVDNLPSDFDQLNARLDAAALLDAAGVRVAFGGSAQNHNARNISQAAGIAVANGMTWESALRAVTRAPAEMYGVAESVGSIEAGKDADFVIWPGDPLQLRNFPEAVYIKGEAVPMQSRQTLLRDRYLDPDAERPPAFRRP